VSVYIDVVFYIYASSEMLVFIHNKPAGKCYVVLAGLHGCVMLHKNLVRLQGSGEARAYYWLEAQMLTSCGFFPSSMIASSGFYPSSMAT